MKTYLPLVVLGWAVIVNRYVRTSLAGAYLMRRY